MKNRLEVLLTLLGMALLVWGLEITQAHAAWQCTANCPPGWTQVSGECPELANQCGPAECKGFITCQSTGTAQIKVSCGCFEPRR